MVSFEQFHMEEGTPIYLQIIRHVKRGIAAGTVSDGEEMPSRRLLSALLGVNPNTVQKAYRMLEEEGLITSHTGTKSFVTVEAAQVEAVRVQLLEGEAMALIRGMKAMGLSCREAGELLERLWDQKEETK